MCRDGLRQHGVYIFLKCFGHERAVVEHVPDQPLLPGMRQVIEREQDVKVAREEPGHAVIQTHEVGSSEGVLNLPAIRRDGTPEQRVVFPDNGPAKAFGVGDIKFEPNGRRVPASIKEVL